MDFLETVLVDGETARHLEKTFFLNFKIFDVQFVNVFMSCV